MQQAAQVVQAKTPQPPTDPAVQKTFEAAMAEIDRKKQYDAEKLKLEQSVAADRSAAAERGAGIDATLHHMQQAFDQRLEASALDRFVPGNRKARQWELLLELYEDIAKEAQDDFWSVFEREFRRAYSTGQGANPAE